MKELWELFKVFAQIGVLTFGGGYAMLPMIQEEIVDKRGWATDEEILDYYAIGQSTPGIISVNTATFIGYKRKGILGAIVATLGIVFPSIVIITVIAIFFDQFEHYQIVQHAFAGIRVAVAALILNAIISMWQKAIKDYLGIIIFLLSFSVVAFLDISPIWVVIISFLVGVIIKGKKVDSK
ncbi:chromate transporter [Defluviitoga tunisiensis]|uniref:Chromate transporter n=1 Tax=Defluviitoga tunisiensis TaxID=1006576 RepID=A0A0C7NQ04_DEFTU|nr:chromate transporter [Defluviitoga tunisiensis]CEP77992.1 chromate transporter [Defluviitoga tunisiensis]